MNANESGASAVVWILDAAGAPKISLLMIEKNGLSKLCRFQKNALRGYTATEMVCKEENVTGDQPEMIKQKEPPQKIKIAGGKHFSALVSAQHFLL